MNFENFTQLVNSINKDLGGFCNEFQYKRKELVDAGRTAGNNELFGNIKEDDGWAINRGGGTEVQFHIAFDKDELIIKYGLGFNTQYVPFAANLISPVDHLRPYMLAFLNLETEIVKILPDYNFIYGSIEQLQNPQFGQYNLFGKTCEVIENNSDFSIADVDYNILLADLKNQFNPYVQIFKLRNKYFKMNLEVTNFTKILFHKKQIILQGPPGTGKTYTAKDIAESVIFGDISSDKKTQKNRLEKSSQFELIQFHPAYTYEDFVRGIVAKSNGQDISYETENKVLGKFALAAYQNWKASNEPNEVVKETWLESVLYDFKAYVALRLDEEEKLMITPKVYIKRISENSIRYNSDAWEIDGGVPDADLLKMYLAEVTTRKQVQELSSLTKTAKSLSTYWLKVLELFKKYIQENNLGPIDDIIIPIEKKFILLIDEINRANLPAVLGELIYALEYRGETVESMYDLDGDRTLVLPANLFIIGTMNTADRSVGHIDYAIRRRFAFVDILPTDTVIDEVVKDFDLNKKAKDLFAKVSALFYEKKSSEDKTTVYLQSDFKAKEVQLGHSYFLVDNEDQLNLKLAYEIKPLLLEYVKDGILNESALKKIGNL